MPRAILQARLGTAPADMLGGQAMAQQTIRIGLVPPRTGPSTSTGKPIALDRVARFTR
jgi:hypothetical protein